MRITEKKLLTLPTRRLYYDDGAWVDTPYLDASTEKSLPILFRHFKPDGRGVPWECGISNAIREAGERLFGHPVLYVHTEPSTIYILAMIRPNRQPKLSIRYKHVFGTWIKGYDSSRTMSPRRQRAFMEELKQYLADHPLLNLHIPRHDPRTGAHGTGGAQTTVYKHTYEGTATRMRTAKLIHPALARIVNQSLTQR
jgi:hypothetical protein